MAWSRSEATGEREADRRAEASIRRSGRGEPRLWLSLLTQFDERQSQSRLRRFEPCSSSQTRGRGRGGARGGARGGTAGARADDRPRKEAILDLSKYLDQRVRVKFTGGREGARAGPLPFPAHVRSVTGTLKGYDQLLNLVMDDIEEIIRGTSPTPRPSSPSFRYRHRRASESFPDEVAWLGCPTRYQLGRFKSCRRVQSYLSSPA